MFILCPATASTSKRFPPCSRDFPAYVDNPGETSYQQNKANTTTTTTVYTADLVNDIYFGWSRLASEQHCFPLILGSALIGPWGIITMLSLARAPCHSTAPVKCGLQHSSVNDPWSSCLTHPSLAVLV